MVLSFQKTVSYIYGAFSYWPPEEAPASNVICQCQVNGRIIDTTLNNSVCKKYNLRNMIKTHGWPVKVALLSSYNAVNRPLNPRETGHLVF